MPLQPEMPANKLSINSTLQNPYFFMFILQAYPGGRTLTVKRHSEEDRQPDSRLKIVCGFFFTQHVYVIQVIAKIEVQCD